MLPDLVITVGKERNRAEEIVTQYSFFCIFQLYYNTGITQNRFACDTIIMHNYMNT